MLITREMLGGSFDANVKALEAALGRPCEGTEVGAVRLFDPSGKAVPFGFVAEPTKFVSAALFEAFAGEQRADSVTIGEDQRAIARAFFGEGLWGAQEGHPTIRFLRDVSDAEVRLTWRPKLDGLYVERSSMIDQAFAQRDLLKDSSYVDAVMATIDDLTSGVVRTATPGPGGAVVHPWVKQAILLYFSLRPMEAMQLGPYHYCDKVPLQAPPEGVRVVPGAVLRYGVHLEDKVIMMPSFANIGARVGRRTMIDTWATVGSCAQVGSDVHIAGGVGIGGVLEPPGARPVVIGNGAFLGSRAIVVEGVEIGDEVVLGAGVVITGSTKIIDMSGAEKKELQKGYIPPRSVVIPGMVSRNFAAGPALIPCALIIGSVTAGTRDKTKLEAWLRENEVSV